MKSNLWIVIDNGEMFEGTLEDFENTFFSNANEGTILRWAKDNKYDCKITIKTQTSEPLNTSLVNIPRYKHDCDRCKFLGTFIFDSPRRHEGKEWTEIEIVDLYMCKDPINSAFDSFIARRSDEGRKYSSSSRTIIESNKWLEQTKDFSSRQPAIIEAYKRSLVLDLSDAVINGVKD